MFVWSWRLKWCLAAALAVKGILYCFSVLFLPDGYAMHNTVDTNVHVYHCPSDMVVRMRRVLARPWVGVWVCHLLLLFERSYLCHRPWQIRANYRKKKGRSIPMGGLKLIYPPLTKSSSTDDPSPLCPGSGPQYFLTSPLGWWALRLRKGLLDLALYIYFYSAKTGLFLAWGWTLENTGKHKARW